MGKVVAVTKPLTRYIVWCDGFKFPKKFNGMQATADYFGVSLITIQKANKAGRGFKTQWGVAYIDELFEESDIGEK